MAKRDILSEIQKKKSRTDLFHQYEFYSRFKNIDALINKITPTLTDSDQEILRTVPISSIGVVESQFRVIYSLIIEKDVAYAKNAFKIIKEHNSHFDPELVLVVKGRTFTLGEVLSHLFRINSLQDIDYTISTLLGIDFLKSFAAYVYEDHLTFQAFFPNAKTNEATRSAMRMFEKRHILVHEFANRFELNKEEILQDYENLKYFVTASTEMMDKLLGYFIGYTQLDFTLYYKSKFEKEEERLQKLLEKIKMTDIANTDLPMVYDGQAFDSVIKKWKDYREAYAIYSAGEFEGGSLASHVAYSRMMFQTRYFVENLEREYGIYLDE